MGTRGTRIAGAALALGLGIFGVYAMGAQAKGGGGGGGTDPRNAGTGAMTCSDPSDSAYFAWKRTGDNVALSIGDAGPNSAGVWTITVVDQGDKAVTTLVAGDVWDYTQSPDWSVLYNLVLQKGPNSVTIMISSTAENQACGAVWSVKV